MKKKLLSFFVTFIILLVSVVPAFADAEVEASAPVDYVDDILSTYDDYIASTTHHYIVDDADLLTDEQEDALEASLAQKSESLSFDIVIVTTFTTDGKTPEAYADDYFDYNGYGQGINHDGCLLLISMEDRDWHISTTGYGITALTDAGIDYIGDEIVYFLSDDDFYNAFVLYADLVNDFVNQSNNGAPYDIGNLPKQVYSATHFELKHVGYGLLVGLIFSLVLINILKGQLKSVHHKAEANDYLQQDSLVITNANDVFITANVVKVKKESSSGGSSTHTGSSGTSHGGGGGKF